MAVKKVLMSKKIQNVLYDIYPKTAADVVEYGEGSVKDALDSLSADFANYYTQDEVDALVEAVDDKLTALIGGDVSLDAAFDTIKEISDWLASGDGAAVSGLISDVSALKTTVGDSTSGLVKGLADAQDDIDALETALGDASSGLTKRVGDLESTVGNASAGLVKQVADLESDMTTAQGDIDALETALGDASSGLTKRVGDLESDMTTAQGDITDLETTVGDATSGLVKKVADLEAVGAVKVEASATNGNIKINGVETTVYDDSAIAASKITQDATHRFATDTEKTTWNSAAHILDSSTGATDNDLIITEIV